jgi:hypothetical protein
VPPEEELPQAAKIDGKAIAPAAPRAAPPSSLRRPICFCETRDDSVEVLTMILQFFTLHQSEETKEDVHLIRDPYLFCALPPFSIWHVGAYSPGPSLLITPCSCLLAGHRPAFRRSFDNITVRQAISADSRRGRAAGIGGLRKSVSSTLATPPQAMA